MASIYDIKPQFQALLRPLVGRLADAGVSANQVTLGAILLSCASGATIMLFAQQHWPLLLVPLVLFIRMALNAIDGMLAREHDMKTPLGAILNELGDVLSDAALYFPIAFVVGINAALIVSVVFLGAVSEMAGVIAIQIGAERRYDGPMGKSDRAFVFGVIGLALGFDLAPVSWINALLIVVALLLALTIINRCRRALEQIA